MTTSHRPAALPFTPRFRAFLSSPRCDPASEFEAIVARVVELDSIRTVCEIGGGATPLLPLETVERLGLDYLVIDISEDELRKADAAYDTLCVDIASHGVIEPNNCGRFDLIVSRMVLEHVHPPRIVHENIYKLLKPGGRALHVFPTLYWPMFTLNWLIPDRVSYTLLRRFQPGRDAEGMAAKFPAHYRWCRGPSRRQIARFRGVGFEVFRWIAYFGQPDYVRAIPPLRWLDRRVSTFLERHPITWLTSTWLTSYSIVELRVNTRESKVWLCSTRHVGDSC